MTSISKSKNFYEQSYCDKGITAQRKYPNEELCRFIGRRFGDLSHLQKQELKAVEMGCGSGANLWMLAHEGFDTYGVDFSGEALSLCKKTLESYGVGAKLFRTDMKQTSFDHNYFSICVDVFSSNCLDTNQGEQFISEVYRILKRGGTFFSYFPSKCSDAFQEHLPSKLIDQNTLNGIYRKSSPFYCQPYSFRFLYPEEYISLLEKSGFNVTYSELISRTYRSREETFSWCVIECQKK
tara:strand:+ start:1822 stop:2535 length:714 start_codon:yes stop_codon:yes gene_type:complete